MEPKPVSWWVRWGPLTVVGSLVSWIVAWYKGAPEPSLVMLVASVLAAGLFFPPYRHVHQERYDGTVWPLWQGVFLIAVGYFGQVVGSVAVGFYAGFRAGVEGRQLVATPELTASFLLAATLSTAAAAFLAVMILRLRGNEWWALGLQPEGFWSALWIGAQSGLVLAGFKLMYFKMLQTLGVWQLAGTGPVQVMFALDGWGYLFVGLLVGAVLVPIAEEILFRGVLFAGLRRLCGPIPAAILSSALFGRLHDEFWFPALLGLVFSLLYHRTGTLWTSIGSHILVNSVTLGLCFAHGSLIERVTWPMVGGIILFVALCQLAAIWLSSTTPPKVCACGLSADQTGPRCARCCFPMSVWPRWATGTLRVVSAALLIGLGGASFSAQWWISQPFDANRGVRWLTLQYNLLKSSNNPLAEKLLEDWYKHDPNSEDVRLFRLGEAYRLEDFPLVVKLVEQRYKGRTNYTAGDANMLSLAYTEMGGRHLQRAIELGEIAVDKAPVHVRPHYEDTLGWAYVRAGMLQEAAQYLDREADIYGQTGKAGMAELCFHRGVVVWALGETDRAIPYLQTAARMGEDGKPFSTRAQTILTEKRLPPGLVPAGPIEFER